MERSDFEDVHERIGDATIDITTSNYYEKFLEAQKWLDERIVNDMEPFVPYRTGRLRNHLKMLNAPRYGSGEIVVYSRPTPSYPLLMYYGYNSNGKPMHFSCPTAQVRWFEGTKRVHEREWVEGVNRIVKGG